MDAPIDNKITKKIAELRDAMAEIGAPNPFREGDIVCVRADHVHAPPRIPSPMTAGTFAGVLKVRPLGDYWADSGDLLLLHRHSSSDSFLVTTVGESRNFELVERAIANEVVKPPVIEANHPEGVVNVREADEGRATTAPLEVQPRPTLRRWWAKVMRLISNEDVKPTGS